MRDPTKPKSLWRKIMDTPIRDLKGNDEFLPKGSQRFRLDNNPFNIHISWSRVVKHMKDILLISVVLFSVIIIVRAFIRMVSSVATSVTPTMNTTTTSALAIPLSFFNSPLFYLAIFAPIAYMIWDGISRARNYD